MSDINVLLIVGARARAVNQTLRQVATETSSDGVTVNVFDSLGDLPPYSENMEDWRVPADVVALRTAAADAHATLVLTNYREPVPTLLHNAIDWLTGRWNHGRLHDKPLAVVSHAAQCYSGVWSHQILDDGCIARSRVVEPITETTLSDVVRKLVGEVNAASEPSWPLPVSGPGSDKHPQERPRSA